MGRKRRKSKKSRAKARSGTGLTVDRKRRTGHYQGSMFSEVYRDGKVHVYTAWNDNDDDVGAPMDFDAWVRSVS